MQNRPNIGNSIVMGQLLEFEVVFPNEQPLTAEEYLRGISKSYVLSAAAFLLSFKNKNSKFEDNRQLITMFFSAENNDFANEVYNRVKAVEKTVKKVSIINPYTSLKLFELFFSKPDEQDEQIEPNKAKFEKNLFKAYLVLNSNFIKAQSVAYDSTKNLDDHFKVSMMIFCMHYAISDKTDYDITKILVTQLIKSIYLFEYVESNPKMEALLTAFLKYFNCQNWQEYLKKLLPLTSSAITNEREAHTDIIVPPGKNFEENCAFVEKLIIKYNDELEGNDFLTTRMKPFYKISDGTYRIIFNLFVVEKIFKGVYFLLRDVNNTLPIGEKIPGLKGVYCYEFSEKTLVYRVMNIIYPNKCLKFTGQQLANMKIIGAPDYYIRKNNNVLIFESKDFLIRANKKSSFDYNVYDEEFSKTLYYEELPNGKEKAGAVMQLINSIKKILKNEFLPDKDYYYKDISIYPILITHDHQYDTPGFNNLINSWFQDELKVLAEEGFFIKHIKPIVVVNIDSLVYQQVGLAEDIPLHTILNAYYDQVAIDPKKSFRNLDELRTYSMQRLIPFSLFIDNYFKKHGIRKLPPVMGTVAPSLFKENLRK